MFRCAFESLLRSGNDRLVLSLKRMDEMNIRKLFTERMIKYGIDRRKMFIERFEPDWNAQTC